MKKSYLQGTKIIELEEEGNIKVLYYLIEEINNLYGIKLIKDDNGKIESQSVRAISYSKEVVEQMICKLIENDVTPMTLVEILDEMITLKICS